MSNLEDFKKYLIEETGEHWIKSVSDRELEYFLNWAAKCQTFPLSVDSPDWLRGNTGDAFRGFVKGLDIARQALSGKGEG